MRNIILILFSISILFAETLFEVKDASNKKVLDVSTDGLRVMNDGDTLMVISPSGVRVNLLNVPDKALSRTFAVTTTASKNKGLNRVLEVGTESTTMREGDLGERYTDFSPSNIFLGLNSGIVCTGASNVFIGNKSGRNTTWGSRNIFLGNQAGENAMCNASILIGEYAGISMGVTDFAEYNIAIGQYAGSSSAGYGNILIGPYAGQQAKGNNNSYIGSEAGKSTTVGFGNVFVGSNAGFSNQTGYSNVFIGNGSGSSNSAGYGNVMIGTSAGSGEIGSNKLYIDNSNTSIPLIYVQFDTNRLGINDGSPTANLHIKQSGTDEEGLAIENDGDTDTWSWEIGNNDLTLYFNGIQVGYWDDATGSYTAVSDSRLKKDIKAIDEKILDKILKLRLVKYRLEHAGADSHSAIGFLAQEVEKFLPSVVRVREDGYLSLNYDDFGVLSIKAVQEQQEMIQELKNENTDLKSRLERLEKLILR